MNTSKNITDKIYKLLDEFLNISTKVIPKHPSIVVILMHEYFRSLYQVILSLRKDMMMTFFLMSKNV